MAGSFYCYSKGSLMLCTVSCDSSRKDLSSFRYISAKLRSILVIDLAVFLAAEYADFLSSVEVAFSLKAAFFFLTVIVWHEYSPL